MRLDFCIFSDKIDVTENVVTIINTLIELVLSLHEKISKHPMSRDIVEFASLEIRCSKKL